MITSTTCEHTKKNFTEQKITTITTILTDDSAIVGYFISYQGLSFKKEEVLSKSNM